MAGLVVENAITGEVVFHTEEVQAPEMQTVEALKFRLSNAAADPVIL